VDDSAIEQASPRQVTRERRLPWVGLAIVGLFILLLFPPFTPPGPWRWITERVPWQIVSRVPWAYQTATVRVSPTVCGSEEVDHLGDPTFVIVTAFGYDWAAPTSRSADRSEAFHRVSRTHGVLGDDGTRITLTRGPAGKKLFCSV
jgi:hypothetical protein